MGFHGEGGVILFSEFAGGIVVSFLFDSSSVMREFEWT